MSHSKKYHRILALAPSSRGFGFVVLDGENTLADWGVKSVEVDKNAGTLTKVGEMIAHYQPDVVVMEDCEAKGSRRSARIQELVEGIVVLAESRKVKIALLSRDQVKRAFFEDGDGTKHTIARIIANRFPEELGDRLPPKRKPWMSEHYNMDMFDAVALALVLRLRKKK